MTRTAWTFVVTSLALVMVTLDNLVVTTAPPTSGPSATARPPIPPQAPSARPRFSDGTAAERSVSVSGAMIAPPTP